MKVSEKDVHESLDNAVENGYPILDWSDEDIAKDLIQNDSGLEDCEIADLLPAIKSWKEGQ